MNTLLQIERIYRLHLLIKQECTGSSADLAIRLHVSQRSVQLYISELRELGATINYDSLHRTYYYVNDFEFNYNFNIAVKERE